MRRLTLAVFMTISGLLAAPPAAAQCVEDAALPGALALTFDPTFAELEFALVDGFPDWLTRWNQINTSDPTPSFLDEDNSQNGIRDDDHLELLAVLLTAAPSATVLGGIDPALVASIRSDYTANRARVKGDLSFSVLGIVPVSIIGEIEKTAPDFAEALQDLVAAYMTIGDAESVAFIRGLLITLGDLFIEEGVRNGVIPNPIFPNIPQLTKDALRGAVNGNFVPSKYACYGDVVNASRANRLGDSGDLNNDGQSNESAYAATNSARAAWLAACGVTNTPPVITLPATLTVAAGDALQPVLTVLGGTAPLAYDWKRIGAGGAFTRVSTARNRIRDYALPGDSGVYQLFVCDAFWTRPSLPLEVTVTPRAFAIAQQPQGVNSGVGGDAQLSVRVVGGLAVPSYQWFFGATAQTLAPIDGATDPTLTLNNLQPTNAGFYQARITGEDLAKAPVTLISNTVQVQVTANLIATEQPQAVSVPRGQPFSLSFGFAGGTPPYTQRWFRNSAPLGAATPLADGPATFGVASAASGNQGNYFCQVSDSSVPVKNLFSNIVAVTVTPPPNNPPQLTAPLDQTLEVNEVRQLPINVSDADNDLVILSAQSDAPQVAIVTTNARDTITITAINPGTALITLGANDLKAPVVTTGFSVTVNAPPAEGEGEGEGTPEGSAEGSAEGEGTPEGAPEGEGLSEGLVEGALEGAVEGAPEGEGISEGLVEGALEGAVEGAPEGEGLSEGLVEGALEGAVEGAPEGEGLSEGLAEGALEGAVEGAPEGEGLSEGVVEGMAEGAAEGEGEGGPVGTECAPELPAAPHSADTDGNGRIALPELLRVIQFFNSGGYCCAEGAPNSPDGFVPGLCAARSCPPHSSDFVLQDWRIALTELLRTIQFFNSGGYQNGDGDDGFAPCRRAA